MIQGRYRARVYSLTILLALPALGSAAGPETIISNFNEVPHTDLIATSDRQVLDHEVGLGALQKVRGVWRFKSSERLSGNLQRFTWQVLDGFTSQEMFEDLSNKLEQVEGASVLFECEGRACGHGAQWANRVFGQRLLYGRDDLQRYRVYRFGEAGEYWVAVYASARTSERQYLHADLIQVSEPSD